MWDILLEYTPDKEKPKITSANIDLNRGKKVKTNYGKAKGKDKRYIVGEENLTQTKWHQLEPYNNLSPRIPDINSANTIKADYDKVTTAYKCKDINIDELYKNDPNKIDEIVNNSVKDISEINRYKYNPWNLIATIYLDVNTKEVNVRDCNITEAGKVDAYSLRIPINKDDILSSEMKAVAGCVPTAWGQIMKYHKWPPKSVGKVDYNLTYTDSLDRYYSIEVDKSLTHNFSWDNEAMPLFSTKEKDEGNISTLLTSIGYSLECEWGSTQSWMGGTVCKSRPNIISKHFGYSTKMEKFIYKVYFTRETDPKYGEFNTYEGGSSIDYDNIVTTIEKDINNSMPLLFSYDYDDKGTLTYTPDDVGHATVIDGYEYFDTLSFSVSINLGWQNFGKDFYTFTRLPFLLKANLVVDIHDFNITGIKVTSGISPCFGDVNSNNCNSEYIQNGGEPKKPNFEIESRWNLKALSTNRDVTSNYFDSAEVIYTYEDDGNNQTWYKNPTYISLKQGFWIKSSEGSNYALIGENDDNTTFAKLEDIEVSDNNWHLLGTGKEISSKLLNDIFYSENSNFTIWIYDNVKNEWIENPNSISKAQGFWAKRESNFINPLE